MAWKLTVKYEVVDFNTTDWSLVINYMPSNLGIENKVSTQSTIPLEGRTPEETAASGIPDARILLLANLPEEYQGLYE